MSLKQAKKTINRSNSLSLTDRRVIKTALGEATIDQVIAIEELRASIPSPVEQYGAALLSGSVTWLSGLTFVVSDCEYIIEGNTYSSQETEVTLDTADATHPRIDVIWVNTSGVAGYTTGTPAADPAKPEVDPLTTLEMTFVTVAAGETAPENVDVVTVYAENAGDPAEWDATESTSTARIALADTSDPYAGTKAIKFTEAVTGDKVILAAGSEGIAVGEIDSVETHIKASVWPTGRQLRVAFFYGTRRVSSWVQIKNNNFGFVSSNTSDYQTVTIPGNSFNFTTAQVTGMQFRVAGTGGPLTGLLDQVRLQTGGGTTVINITQGLTESQLINNVRTWNTQQAFGNDTLTDAATVAWDLDSSPIATITLGGNRTLDITNIRAGGTYIIFVDQDATGSRTMTWDAAIEWAGGTAPTLTTDANGQDMFTLVAKSDTVLYGVSGGLAFA